MAIAAGEGEQRPNVLVILADDPGLEHLGAAGNPVGVLPGISRTVRGDTFLESATPDAAG